MRLGNILISPHPLLIPSWPLLPFIQAILIINNMSQQFSQPQPQQGGYAPQQFDATGGQDGERGLGLRLFTGAVAGAVAGYGYHRYKRHVKKKKQVKCADGRTREIECDVMVDEHDRELPDQAFDEHGRNITAPPAQQQQQQHNNSDQIQGAPWDQQQQQQQPGYPPQPYGYPPQCYQQQQPHYGQGAYPPAPYHH
jgi:hypothetical protein